MKEHNQPCAYEKELLALKNELTEAKAEIEELKRSNPLWGKKYYACGDSFTQGDFSGYVDPDGLEKEASPELYDTEWDMYKTYPWQIGRRNHMTVINEALRGSTLAMNEEPTKYRPFSWKRYLQIPEDADYCTLWFGINDSAHGRLGALGDITNETFYGAWDVVFRWILTNRPMMKTGVIVTNDCPKEYRDATIESCRRWGIPYLDLMGDVSVPMITRREEFTGICEEAIRLRGDFFYVSAENDHPNLKAHIYESYIIENFMRSL